MEELISAKLVQHQAALRAEVEAWASAQTSSINAACARYEFEAAVMDAVLGETEWMENTGSDLCAALGHCTLAYRVQNII